MESYLAVYEVRPRWKVVYVHSFYTRMYSHYCVAREACGKYYFNSQGKTVIENVRQIPSKTKINSFTVSTQKITPVYKIFKNLVMNPAMYFSIGCLEKWELGNGTGEWGAGDGNQQQ